MVNAIFPRYIQVPAGEKHTVLLRSDGHAVASGLESLGRCQIPPLAEGMTHLDRVKFSWLGLGGLFLVRLLTWIVFMLGFCLCNVEFGISGMALSAMSGPTHVCSFAMFIFGIALLSPHLVWG